MIYKKFDDDYKAIKYPDAAVIKKNRWDEFNQERQPTMSMVLTHDDLKNLIKEREAKHHEEVKAEITRLRKEYNQKCADVTQAFKKELEKQYLVDPNSPTPKAEKLWAICWNYGHSSGYSDIENYYVDLVSLIN